MMKKLADKDYSALVDNITIVSRTDLNGNFIDVNEKFCELSGYTREELIGQKPRMLTHPSVKESFHKEVWDSLKHNQIWHGVFKNINKRGDTYYLRSTIYPVINKNNKKIGYIATRYLSSEQATQKVVKKEKTLSDDNEMLRLKLEEAKREIEKLKEELDNK